ncbi:subclass B3 metallo-beta-lactamase [Glacieibacterium frigidum]|uniref:Subclass B3 metallo-beta-lactamase n=1 Tax=Glacieibacterium frigidum TaxID=2593303 RepID=A0A552UH95_9SPHN|nr:subclass B3 metallo-beta-lactamase [Glacieibacterium frigidum]TRW17594.1 subclass B3 metallo-beta-lactamase [Glacieibacterium frigidum]
MMRFALLAALVCPTPAAAALDPPAWTEPTAPFRIVGNIYYVGSKGLAAYLITSPRGHVLLDGTMDENVEGIERNIEGLGFRLRDVKLLLNSHAHFDHAAGLARLKRDTGATMVASAADRGALESGTPPSIVSYGVVTFPAVKVDRLLREGRPERVGSIALTPIVTPGHTPGCTTWTTTTKERGRTLRVVFPCSLTVAGNKLIDNTGYPGIVADFRRSFPATAKLRADVVLPGHPEGVELLARAARRDAGDADAFLMPGLLPKLAADAKKAFEAELTRQTK